MKRWLNSLAFRQVILLLLTPMLVATIIYVSLNAFEELNDENNQIDFAHEQKANAYLLTIYAYGLMLPEDEAEEVSILNSIQTIITDYEKQHAKIREEILSEGDEEVNQAETLAALNTVDENWTTYISKLEAISTSTSPARLGKLRELWEYSSAVADSADQFAQIIDSTREQETDSVLRAYEIVGVISFLAMLAAAYLQYQIVKASRGLGKATQAYASGDRTARAPTNTLTEIAEGAVIFNNMADQLNQLIADLEHQVQEAQKARAEAERASQVKSAFLASVSHELRTPLNSIINFTKFVHKGVMGPVNERQQETLTKVIDSGHHLLNLINDVLDMSKIESGSLSLFVEENVNLQQILDTVVTDAKGMLHEKPVELRVETQGELPAIVGDRKRILQIFLNIVSNACKFTQEGHITIKAHQQNGHVHIAVEDTGPGIAPEDSSAVFESFKQTSTGLRQGEGTGLGMPISRNLAEAHGGKLWFESQVGQGTTFYVTLPVKSEILTPV